MRVRAVALTMCVGAVFTATASGGHHPLGELYVRDRTITMSGRITAVEWVNPHVVLTLAVEDQARKVQAWRIELDPPGALTRRNWPRDRVTAGASVTVTAYPSHDGGPSAVARTVTLSSGEQLVATTDSSWNWRRTSSR